MATYYSSDEPLDLRGHSFGSGHVYDGDTAPDDLDDEEPAGTVVNVFHFNGQVLVDEDYAEDGDIVNGW